jgi:hypothetical protein
LGGIIPASWINSKPKNDSADLTSVTQIDVTPKDKNTDQPLSWKQITLKAFSDQPETLDQLKSAPIDSGAISQLNDENNLTASFSKNLYLASAYLKENNITDESAKQNVINQLIEQEAAKIVPTVYHYSDLNVAKTESNDSIKAYGNSVASILSDVVSVKVLNDDLKAIDNFTKTQDSASIMILKKDSDRVALIMKKMLNVSVPPSATIYHISALNQLAVYNDMLKNLSKADTDSLRANIALKNYSNAVLSVVKLYKNLSEYFDIKNIAFSLKESGYVFTVGYTIK